ncbi:MAG: hypothetical protein ACSLFD_06100 [Solirubrobacterales bacterium]
MITRLCSAILVSLALVLGLGAANAAAVPSGTYKGQTKGELDVKVKVKNNRITRFESSVYASCYLDNFIISFAYPPVGQRGKSTKIKADGSFRVVFKGDPDVSFNDDKRTLKGKFKGGKVTGSMKVEGLCSADTTFKAKK